MPTVAEINTAIDEVLTKPKMDYTIGDKRVTRSAYLSALIKMRESLLKTLDVDITQIAFDFDIDEFGIDNTQFEL